MATYPTVELYVNSTWTDITSYVRYSGMIDITRGQSGEGATTDTSTCRMTLDNTDGRFSPRNPTGAYYGQIGRNTPIRVSLDGGEAYLNCPGASGDRASTPDHADLDITGDIDVRFELSNTDWDTDDTQELIGKYNTTGNQRSWRLEIIDGGYPRYHWSNDGTTVNTVTATNTIVNRGVRRVAIRVTHDVNDGAGNNVVTFYTAESVSSTDWRQLGTVITTAGTTSIFASTATLDIADIQNLNFDPLIGRVHRAQVRNGIAGTVVANPDFTTQTVGATSFVDSAGRTWTLAGNTSIKNRKERFTGEVSSWPATSDMSGNDKTVSVEAAGILRRLTQGASPLESAIMRYVKTEFVQECWPLNDGILSTVGDPIYSGTSMTLRTAAGTNTPNWGGGTLADWVEPVVQLPTEHWGDMRGYVAENSLLATSWHVDFAYAGKKDFDFLCTDRSAGTDADPKIGFRLTFDQSADQILLYALSVGETSSSVSLEDTITNAGVFDGTAHAIRLTISNSGADAAYVIYIDGVQEANGTATGYAANSLLYVQPEWDYQAVTSDTPSIGFITVSSLGGPNASDYSDALKGYRNETAGARIARLCEEEGISYWRYGDGTTTYMRPQGMDTLVDLLRECEAADLGILYEPRDAIGLAYRDRTALENQSAFLALTYSDHELSASLAPVEDDQNTRNDITVTQLYGNAYQVTLDSGTLSTQSPPNGVGRYTTSVTASLNVNADLPNYANWLLHLGTVDEARYPTLSVNLRHSTFTASTSMMEDALMLDVGDRVTVDGIPSWWPPDTITQLSVGFSERLGILERDIVINCAPESPYHTAETSGDYDRADTDGCTLAEALDTTETDVTVLTQIGSAGWCTTADYASQFPFDVKTGGEVMRVTACTGAAEDDFSTNQTDSWGTADVGGSWTNAGGAATDFDVAAGVGTHLMTSVSVSRRSSLTSPSASFDLYVDVATSALATGDSMFGGPMARYVDINNLYMARVEFTTAQAVILGIRERVAGVETSLGSFTTRLTHAAGTYVRVRFQGSGTALKAKVWQVGQDEPGPWQISVTDSSLTSAGGIGCRSILGSANTNVNPTISYDNFELINPQILTVTRSQNSVVKSHSSGADIRLAEPGIVPF